MVMHKPHALDNACRNFAGWGMPRVIAQVLAFIANLWTLARLPT
jgi:hypothetical protein